MRSGLRGAGGFTLIEVLVVIVVIAVLAAIVIPRVSAAVRESRESQLRANLHELRGAVTLFSAHCDDWPGQLADLLSTDGSGLVGGSGEPISASYYKGPYLIPCPVPRLPLDPFTGNRDWTYEPTTGAVHSSSTLVASDGTLYSNW